MSDPVLDFFSDSADGDKDAVSGDPTHAFFASGGESPVSAPESGSPHSKSRSPVDDIKDVAKFGLNVLSSQGANIIGGWRGLYELAAGHGADAAANTVREEQRNRTYQPEEGSGAAKAINAFNSKYNPLTWPGRLAHGAGDLTMSLTNSPAAATAVETGLNAIPMIWGARSAFRGAPGAIPEEVASEAPEAAETPSNSELSATGAPRSAAFEAEDNAPPTTVSAPANLSASGAPRPAPYEVPNSPAEPEPLVADHPMGIADEAEQARRTSVLQRIGLNEARQSAITGDAKAAATDYQTSKLDSPAGNRMRQVLDNERVAIENYAEGIVHQTGGSVGTDQSTLMARGQTILAPLDGLKQYFDDATNALYKAADERASNAPIELPELHKLVAGDQADFLGTTEGEALLRGMKARMKSLGMTDRDADPQSVTVQQAEQLKQYLNNQWSPRTARLIRSVKDAIDDDVTKAAGTDIYQQARAMRALRARTLDDPAGISKLMDSSGPDGVNRMVPEEKIADSVTTMPVAQMAHIIKTLKNVPEDLQPQAEAALNEIKAHFANKVLDAGKSTKSLWNTKGVDQYLKSNTGRMSQVFDTDELSQFRDLSSAGKILGKDQSYPGAAVQEHNLVRSGAMAAIRGGSTAAGAAVAGPIGSVVGSALGEKMAGKFNEAAALKEINKRIVNINQTVH